MRQLCPLQRRCRKLSSCGVLHTDYQRCRSTLYMNASRRIFPGITRRNAPAALRLLQRYGPDHSHHSFPNENIQRENAMSLPDRVPSSPADFGRVLKHAFAVINLQAFVHEPQPINKRPLRPVPPKRHKTGSESVLQRRLACLFPSSPMH